MFSRTATAAMQHVCPACSAKFPTLDRLDFHLNCACISRKRPALTPSVAAAEFACPACDKRLTSESALNFHLDHACASKPAPVLPLAQPASACPTPPGLQIVRDFLTFEEEATLVEWLSPQRWQPSKRNGKCLSLHWGVVIDYSGAVPRTRMPRAEAGELPLPSELQFILERFTQHVETGSAWHPNECNANEYVRARGDYLTPHFDDRKLSGDIICNVNLLSDCVMQFSKPGSTSAPFRVKLPRFSASVMSRSSRFEYRHEILHEDFLGERRISLNFRQQSPPPV